MNPFGTTRSRIVRGDHALIAPDSHVLAPLPGWYETKGIILIAPRLGAGFVQYLAHLTAESRALPAAPGIERFLYVLQGTVRIGDTDLTTGGYAYLPPGSTVPVASASDASVLNVFEKEYTPQPGIAAPTKPLLGQEQNVEGLPFLGDPDARLQTLLPVDDLAYDLAVNIFTYQPGATLPFVETHIMEHGLLMIGGAGVYRLGESYYPVHEGDAIWMAPYCPQWFVAMGKVPARYLYYKDVNRDPLTPLPPRPASLGARGSIGFLERSNPSITIPETPPRPQRSGERGQVHKCVNVGGEGVERGQGDEGL